MELTEASIEQMNEIIALFDGWMRYEDNYGIWFKREQLITCLHPKLQELKYHTSWDWLMPVWVKFREIIFHEETAMKLHLNYVARIAEHIGYSTISAAHYRIYTAIQWYNQQINKP